MLDRFDTFNMRRRRGKCSSETKGSNKFSRKIKRMKRPIEMVTVYPQTDPSPNVRRVRACSRPADPAQQQRIPSVSCQGREEHPSCEAALKLDDREGKENEMRIQFESDHHHVTMGGEETASDKNLIFPDDNSNEILPVEQFFGNMEVVQDCPQRPPEASTSTWNKREHRRRRYYAKEDSDEEGLDEEAGLSDTMQPDDRDDS